MHTISMDTLRKIAKIILILSFLLVIVSIVGFMDLSHVNEKLN